MYSNPFLNVAIYIAAEICILGKRNNKRSRPIQIMSPVSNDYCLKRDLANNVTLHIEIHLKHDDKIC